MLRGSSRFKRPQVSRNYRNLHVIPIAGVENNVVHLPVQMLQNPVLEQQRILTPIPLSTASNFHDNNSSYPERYNRKRKRNRRRRREHFANKTAPPVSSFKWFNPIISGKSNNNDVGVALPVKEPEEVKVLPEAPVEEDFEEVEVASSEGEGKKVCVGFRKTKLLYLNYKRSSFFKPKIYNFSSQRTIVSCLNVDDDDSVDVDVVSEAEYDEYEIGDNVDSAEKMDKIIEIEEESSNENTDEAEEEAIYASNEIDAHVVTDEVSEQPSNEVDEDSTDTITITDEEDQESTHAVVNEVDKKSVCAATTKVDKKTVSSVSIKVDEKPADTMIDEAKNEILHNSNETTVSIPRIYKTCIESSDDLFQGKSLIQDKLDAWESHLIGIEYLLEIQDKNKSSVLKYFCVLCDEDLEFKELPEVYVINHVNGCNHVTKYLEKHFPTSKFKFGENSSYDFVIQKLCEKINENLGFYYMCITNNDYYTDNNLKIKEIIQKALHPSESDFKFEKSTFEKAVDSDLLDNISNIMKDIIRKAIPESESTLTELKKVSKANKSISEGKLTDRNVKTKETAQKPRPKHKGNSCVSTFLRLSFAANTKLGSKESSKKSKAVQNKKAESNKQNQENAKSHIEQQVSEVIKSDNKEVVENLESKNNQAPKKQISKNVVENLEPKNDQALKNPISKIGVKNLGSKDDQIFKKPISKNSVKNLGSKDDQIFKKPMPKIAVGNVKIKDEPVSETIEPKNEKAADNVELKSKQLEEKELGNKAQKLGDSAAVESQKVGSDVSTDITSKNIFKNKEKIMKPTMHSKYCRKRILDNGIARLRLAANKTTTKSRLVSGVSDKSNVKSKSVMENVGSDAPKKIIFKKPKAELKETKTFTFSLKKKPLYKVSRLEPEVDSKSPIPGYTSSHQKSGHKQNIQISSKDEISTVVNESSHWIPMKSSSPVLTSDISLFLKKIAVGKTESSVKKRRISKSPVRKITSPLRLFSKSSRRYSKSPHRKRDSKSPVRRKSRSPYRRSSKSPIRISRSPIRRRSRSPSRHHSRSPRRRSRSPLRHRSRSPIRRYSRSPLRRRSRSPRRRHSRSPLRRRSRSPLRKRSRSPLRKRSRSPLRRHSRSPLKLRSRSPHRRYSRSPVKRQSRSPYRRHSRSPIEKLPNLNIYKNLHQINTSNILQSSSSREYCSSDEDYLRNEFNFPKHVDLHKSEITRSRDASKMLHSSKISKPERYKPQGLSSFSARDIIDLDPVSDEDESIYFNDKHLRSEDTNISPSSKAMLSKLWQKLSGADNTSEPGINNLLQFMEAHRPEIEEFIALKSIPKSEKTNAMKIESNLQQQTLLLQQYLLANLAGRVQEPVPSVSNVQYMPPQQPFLPPNISPRFQHPPVVNMPPPTNMPPVPPQPAPMQPRFFPPNVNVPPPHLFQHSNQPIQDFSPKPKPAPEVMFKDLKATVNKLFGANEGGMKQVSKSRQLPAFVTEPDPDKWDLNHPNAPKFNVSPGQKNIFQSPVKNVNFGGMHENPVMKEQISSRNNSNTPEKFFSSSSSNDRSQVSNVFVPPPNAKVTFCDSPRSSAKGNLFPVVNRDFSASSSSTRGGVNDVKVSLAQRLASVLVKIGMVDVPAPLLQEMLMKIGAFSSSPRQDISENEILSILKRLGYL